MVNLLKNLTPETLEQSGLSWEHPPLRWEALDEGGIRVHVPGLADYFRDPAGDHIKDDAPYLYQPVSGDFVARALVRPNFASTYDSGVIMVRQDAQNWAKLCFEKTDFGTTAAVSVVTRGLSDDANGVDVNVSQLWLQVARVGQVFALHYALDDGSLRMVRVFNLNVPETVKVGIVAQCPAGPGAVIDFLSFSLEQRTIGNVRSGI